MSNSSTDSPVIYWKFSPFRDKLEKSNLLFLKYKLRSNVIIFDFFFTNSASSSEILVFNWSGVSTSLVFLREISFWLFLVPDFDFVGWLLLLLIGLLFLSTFTPLIMFVAAIHLLLASLNVCFCFFVGSFAHLNFFFLGF